MRIARRGYNERTAENPPHKGNIVGKYILGVVSGILLCVLVVVAVIGAAFLFRDKGPRVESGSVLVMRLSGEIPEYTPAIMPFEFLDGGGHATLLDVHQAFQKAAKDERIAGIALELGGVRCGWAKAQELRWNIEEFKKSGKPVLAFMQVGGTRDYHIASAADEIYMPPEGFLDLKGLRLEVSFYKDTLAKLGIVAEMEHIGKYKSFAEPPSRSNMSDAFREVSNSILDEVYGQLVADLSASRNMTGDELKAVVDNGPFIPVTALGAKLIDGLKYEDEFFDLFKEKLGVEEVKRTPLNQYRKVAMESLGLTGERRVAIVYASGAIVRGRSDNDPFGDSDVLASDTMSETLRDVAKDDKIEAVVFRIDSPGGDAIASDQMWREMNRLSEKKPVVVSMSDVAASGGYYIAMAGAPVLAYPGTYTGSIGVVFGKVSLAGLYEKIGLNKEILTRGRFAAIDTETRTMTEPERAKLRESIESLYKGFVQKVADSREKEWAEIDEVAQGRVWMGSQALENGLVDELGGIDRAIAMAKEKAGIGRDEAVNLVVYPAKKHWLQMILDEELNAENARLVRWIKARIPDLPQWRAVMQGGMLAVAPYWVTVE